MAFPEHQVPPPPPPDWPEPFPPPPYASGGPGPGPGFYPLTIGRTVSLAFSMFRFGWRTFASINLIAAIPVIVIQAIVSAATIQSLVDWQRAALSSVRVRPVVLPPFPLEALGLTFLVSLALTTITFIGMAALLHAIATAIAGGRLSTRDSYRAAFARFKDVLLVYLALTVVGLGFSMLVLLVPILSLSSAGLLGNGGALAFVGVLGGVAIFFVSVFLVIRLSFTLQALMIENLSASAALKRSYRLMAGSMWRYCGYALLLALILGLIGLVFDIFGLVVGSLFGPLNLGSTTLVANPAATIAQTVTTSLLAEVIAPIFTIAITFLYFDIRWRHGETVPVPGGGETTRPVNAGPF